MTEEKLRLSLCIPTIDEDGSSVNSWVTLNVNANDPNGSLPTLITENGSIVYEVDKHTEELMEQVDLTLYDSFGRLNYTRLSDLLDAYEYARRRYRNCM